MDACQHQRKTCIKMMLEVRGREISAKNCRHHPHNLWCHHILHTREHQMASRDSIQSCMVRNCITFILFFFTVHKFNDNDSIVAVRVDKTEFPPDKDDSILRAEENQEPEVPVTSPVRQRHRLVGGAVGGYSSGSSEDSRSSVATPSLHHSYETLNMSDCGLSQPHRPAPKPPGGCRYHHHLTFGVTKIDGNW